MSYNKEIKDKVYINGEWIEDYYLTSEKNQELKDLRKDLTNESQTREENDTKLANNINAAKNEANTKLNAAITSVKEDIKTATDTLQNTITAETNRAKEKETQLEQAISKEEKRANQQEKELVKQLNDFKTNVSETYETKIDANAKKDELNNTITTKIDEAKTELQKNIKDSINAVTGEDVDAAYDTLKEIADWIKKDETGTAGLIQRIEKVESTNATQDTSILDLKSADTRIEGKVDANTSEITSLKETLSALDPESGGVQELVDKVNTHETDISNLKAKDTELENKFNSYTTTEDLNTQLNNYVTKDGNKVLSDNNYTTEEKNKLAKFEDADNYEKIINKKDTLDDANTTTYPTTNAVKTYIDEKIQAIGNIEPENLVHKTGDPQRVTASTTFTNMFVGGVKLDTDVDNNNLILTDEDDNEKGILVSEINSKDDTGVIAKINTFRYVFKNAEVLDKPYFDYAPYDPTYNNAVVPSRTLATADYVNNRLSAIEAANESDILQVSYICATKADADSVLSNLDIDDKVLVIENSMPTIYVVAEQEGVQTLVQDNSAVQLIYSDKYVESQVERDEFRIYGFIVKLGDSETAEVEMKLVYPLSTGKLTLNKGTSSTVFTGLEDKTVDIPDAYTKTESDNKYVAKSGYVAYSDAEKTKLAALDSTLYEKLASRKTSLDTVDNSTYPTTSAVKTYVDTNFVKKDGTKVLSTNDYTAAEKQKLAGLDATLYEKVANKVTTLETVSESTYPSSKAVKDYIDGKGYNSGKIYKYIYDIDFDLQSADHTKALQGKLTLYLDSKDTTIGNALTGTSAVTWLINYITTKTSVDSKIYGAFLFGNSGTSYIVSAIYNFGGEIYCYSPATIEGSTISADTATSVVSINYRGYTLN